MDLTKIAEGSEQNEYQFRQHRAVIRHIKIAHHRRLPTLEKRCKHPAHDCIARIEGRVCVGTSYAEHHKRNDEDTVYGHIRQNVVHDFVNHPAHSEDVEYNIF